MGLSNADCLQGMSRLEDRSIDLIVTDPPYDIQDMTPYFEQFVRVLKSSGSMYIFGDKNIVAEHWFRQLNMSNKELLIWYYKNSPKPKGRWRISMQALIYAYGEDSVFYEDEARIPYQPATTKLNGRLRPSSGRLAKCQPYCTEKGALPRDVIEHPALLGHLASERVGHPDQKPLGLIEKLVRASSNPGDLVLDAFAGSGTTIFACLNLDRRFIAFERDADWCSYIQREIDSCTNIEEVVKNA